MNTENYLLNFNLNNKETIQAIFFGHIYGTTYSIGAQVLDHCLNDEGHLTDLSLKFKSTGMGGYINYAINRVESEVNYHADKTDEHRVFIKLNIFKNQDHNNDKVNLHFKNPFKLQVDQLLIKMTENEITNLSDEMISEKLKKIDFDNFCKLALTL